MKQASNTFSFKKNENISALPDAKPPEKQLATPTDKQKVIQPKRKLGRKPESAEGARKVQISGYLTPTENEKFKAKLDGRPASAVVRNLILQYIDCG